MTKIFGIELPDIAMLAMAVSMFIILIFR